jgi:hypothetical protein
LIDARRQNQEGYRAEFQHCVVEGTYIEA